MPGEEAVSSIIKGTSPALRIGVWRRVARGVAHDLLNAAMPLRSLGSPPPPGGGDVEARIQLARDTSERVTSLGVGLHRLEASIKDDGEEEEGRWPLLREMIRWAVPRGVRIEHDDRAQDLGSTLTPASATLVFWTAVFCGELVEPDSGEIALDANPDTLALRLPGRAGSDGARSDAGEVAAEAAAALQALARAGVIEMSGDPSAGGGVTVTIQVTYRGADLPRRAKV